MILFIFTLLTVESGEEAAEWDGGFYGLPWRDVATFGHPEAEDFFNHNLPPNISSFEESSDGNYIFTGTSTWKPEESNDALEIALHEGNISIVKLLIEKFGFDARGSLKKYFYLSEGEPNLELTIYLMGLEVNSPLEGEKILKHFRFRKEKVDIAKVILAKAPDSISLSTFPNDRDYVRLLINHGFKPRLEDIYRRDQGPETILWDLFRSAEPEIISASTLGTLSTRAKEQRLCELFHLAALTRKLSKGVIFNNIRPFLWKEVNYQGSAKQRDYAHKVDVLAQILPLVESHEKPKEELLSIFIDTQYDSDLAKKMIETLTEKVRGKPRAQKRVIKDAFNLSEGVEKWGFWCDMEMKRNKSFREAFTELNKVFKERS